MTTELKNYLDHDIRRDWRKRIKHCIDTQCIEWLGDQLDRCLNALEDTEGQSYAIQRKLDSALSKAVIAEHHRIEWQERAEDEAGCMQKPNSVLQDGFSGLHAVEVLRIRRESQATPAPRRGYQEIAKLEFCNWLTIL